LLDNRICLKTSITRVPAKKPFDWLDKSFHR